MPRPCQRVRLESGLKLDLNPLARNGFVHPGAVSGPVGISWTDSRFGHEIASGIISSDLTGPYEGLLWISIGDLRQKIHMVARRRHFGGHQWFFICPDTTRRAMVLWKPPGADHFASRHRLPTPRNLRRRLNGLTWARRRSIRGYARSAASTPMSGICRQSRKGCVGIPTTAPLRNSIDTKKYWTRGHVELCSGN